MTNPLHQFINDNKELLEKGEVLTILLLDGYVTIFNEVDEKTNMEKTVTLVDPCDTHFDCEIAHLIPMGG
ncbi:hypothetical protein NLX67_15250 [Domibacillus sp. A3M-37]|uniref:hypothetical protein n=1 Tax=Domibacillus sp. A3M-37 TaxID=2962037 RepID=UPI0020B89394|nr:hypothetical protein [Domibacillus sp. A3M-37]MCP3763730.1 hypothetical protein [Domibacillus sp. A3M-37]